MSIPDDVLMAYVDGELPAEERARVEAAMQDDASIARRVAEQKKLRADLRAAFDGVLREPVPERLLAAARGNPVAGTSASEQRGSVSDFAAAAQARNAAREARSGRRWSWPEWGAIAASLVIGVIVAQFAMRSPGGSPFTSEQGRLLAQGELARTLSDQLASEPAARDNTTVGVSFRAKDGTYCRSFTMRSSSTAGLACRDGDTWRVDLLARTDATSGEYAQAGSALPPAVLNAIEQQIDGEPLDAAAEARARESDWQSAPAP
jgi:hypothetical protein